MKPQGGLTLAASVVSECVGSMGRGESAPTVVANGACPASMAARGSRSGPPTPTFLYVLDDAARVD